MLNPALSFLEAHPTEVVVFCIKQEHSTRGDAAFAHGVYWNYLNNNLTRYYLDDHMPQIGQVRGKLVIMCQLTDTEGLPLGAQLVWGNNTTGSSYSSQQFDYYVQDHYDITDNTNYDPKISQIESCLQKAHEETSPANHLYLNYTSCEKLLDHYLETIASNINPVINSFLTSGTIWHNCGVVMVNFAGGSDDGTVETELHPLFDVHTLGNFFPQPEPIGDHQSDFPVALGLAHRLNTLFLKENTEILVIAVYAKVLLLKLGV